MIDIPTNESTSTVLTAENLTKTYGVLKFHWKINRHTWKPIKGQHIAINPT